MSTANKEFDKYTPPYLLPGEKYPSRFPDEDDPYANYTLNLKALQYIDRRVLVLIIDLLATQVAVHSHCGNSVELDFYLSDSDERAGVDLESDIVLTETINIAERLLRDRLYGATEK